jgi:archaellum component FlaC
MSDIDNKVDRWDHDDLQQQVWSLKETVEQLQMQLTLLTNDLNTIKMEGCWRFVEDPKHIHRSSNE